MSSEVEVIEGRCNATTLAGQPCKMRPTADGWCMSHSPNRAELRHEQRQRGGKLTQARKALAKVKADAVAKFGLEADVPDLESVEAAQRYLMGVAARVESRQLSPGQGNTLVNVVRLAKDLLGLSLDLKLFEKLDELEGR